MREALRDAAGGGELDFGELRRRFVNAAMADRAGGSLSTAVKHWLRFCIHGRRISPVRSVGTKDSDKRKLAEEALLMDFVLWLVLSRPTGRSISIDTAAKYVSTVKAWHLRHFGRAIGGGIELARLKDMLKGMRRELGQPPKRVRYGVRTQHLAAAMRSYDTSAANTAERLNAINWRAALSTAFCGLLRAAEMALQPGETWNPELHLSRADVTFHYDADGRRHATVMMRPVKNGRTMRGKGTPLVFDGGASLIDPVQALWELVEGDPVPSARAASTPLFRLRRYGVCECLRVRDVRAEVRRLMGDLGLDEARFGAHSLRIGGATAAAAAGVPPSVIRCCGRWNSDIFEIYTRVTRQAAARMTRVIGSTPFEDLEREEFHCEELELLPSELAVAPRFERCELADEDEL